MAKEDEEQTSYPFKWR